MKRLVLVILLLAAVAAQAQTKLYKEYEHRREVKQVMCKMNYAVGGIKIDVTLIQMNDDRAFARVCRECGITPDFANRRSQQGIFYLRLHDNKDPHKPVPTKDGAPVLKKACLVGASLEEHTVYVFHDIRNQERYQAVLHFIKELKTEN